MKIDITNIYGMSMESTAQVAQNKMALLARQQGANELGIYRYDVSSDSPEQLRTRIDGINASLQANDILIFQLPTWNGLEFETAYFNQAKVYGAKIVFFIQDVPPLMFKANYDDWMQPYVNFFNQADLLILPTPAMEEKLKEFGLTTPAVYQRLWDHPTDYEPPHAEFARELAFLGSQSRFPFTKDWQAQTKLLLFSRNAEVQPDQNIELAGFYPDDLLLRALDRGFGLCWSIDTPEQEERKYSHLNVSYKLSTYLAAGLPVVANADISAADIIEKHHLGFLAHDLAEADRLVQECTEEEYRDMADHAWRYGYLLRNGYVFKRILNEVVEKLMTM